MPTILSHLLTSRHQIMHIRYWRLGIKLSRAVYMQLNMKHDTDFNKGACTPPQYITKFSCTKLFSFTNRNPTASTKSHWSRNPGNEIELIRQKCVPTHLMFIATPENTIKAHQ